MIYRLLADTVFIFHLGFVLFAVFGAGLILFRRAFVWLHLPAVLWSFSVEIFRLPCPLTTLENRLLELGGAAGYADGFVEHYVSMILYANVTPQLQMFLGVLLVLFNLLVYTLVFRKIRRLK